MFRIEKLGKVNDVACKAQFGVAEIRRKVTIDCLGASREVAIPTAPLGDI